MTNNKHFIFNLLFVVLLFLSCSTQSGYYVKSFFFDGVTNPNVIIIQDTSDVIIKDTIFVDNKKNELNVSPILGSIHPPFEQRKCFECHDEKNRTKGKLPQRVLCFSCHDGYNKMYEVTHGPVDFGLCTACHNPHKTGQKKLLYSVQQDLCLQCHVIDDVLVNGFHAKIADQSCINCHNPHGGQNRRFLKKEACLQCHPKTIEKKQFIHGPVASGECGLCHKPHNSKESNLLVITGNKLCLNCHNVDIIYSKEYHIKKKKQNCLECHDPHGSNQSFLIINTSG